MSQEVTFEVTGTEPPDGRYRACRAVFEAWRELGLPDMRAPRGGRATSCIAMMKVSPGPNHRRLWIRNVMTGIPPSWNSMTAR